jgi:ParB-like chromosome segregation protein Spo0J
MTDEPEIAASWVAIDALAPWADNPRINDAAVDKVAASIKRFGFGAPIVAREADGMVIAGHTRLKAARALGLDRVPVRYLDLDPADAKMLAISDNRVGEEASWDGALLVAQLAALDADALALGPLGFDDDELAGLLDALSVPEDADWGDALGGLPTEDRQPFRQMTFTVHDDQHEQIAEALKAAKSAGPFDSDNENSNGNALARIAESFLTVAGRDVG